MQPECQIANARNSFEMRDSVDVGRAETVQQCSESERACSSSSTASQRSLHANTCNVTTRCTHSRDLRANSCITDASAAEPANLAIDTKRNRFVWLQAPEHLPSPSPFRKQTWQAYRPFLRSVCRTLCSWLPTTSSRRCVHTKLFGNTLWGQGGTPSCTVLRMKPLVQRPCCIGVLRDNRRYGWCGHLFGMFRNHSRTSLARQERTFRLLVPQRQAYARWRQALVRGSSTGSRTQSSSQWRLDLIESK
jgi:hypothetical protein